MKKRLLLMLLIITAASNAATESNVNASVNLIKALEITATSGETQKVITNTQKGLIEFPEIELITKGNPGTSIVLSTPQKLELDKGGTKIPVDVSFKVGTVTTDGSDVKSIQVIEAGGNIVNKLAISTNLEAELTAGTYQGTALVTAEYN